MKVLFLDEPLILYLIPRNFPEINDTLTLNLRNEANNVTISPNITFNIGHRWLEIEIIEQPNDFKKQNKYEIELKNGENTIYLGKMLVLNADTDLQNYTYNSQNNGFY